MKMDEVERFKELNGKVTYSTKELIGGLHVKLDRLEQRLMQGEKSFSKIDTTLKWHFKAISLLYVIIGMFLIKPIRYVIRLIGG